MILQKLNGLGHHLLLSGWVNSQLQVVLGKKVQELAIPGDAQRLHCRCAPKLTSGVCEEDVVLDGGFHG